MEKLLSVVVALAALAASVPAASGPDSLSSADSTSVFTMPEILVAATRIPEPSSVLSLSTERAPLTERPSAVLDETERVLDGHPGLDIRSYAAFNGLSSVGIWGAGTQQTLVTVDGHPTTDAFSGITDLGLIPLGDMAEVEMARGSVSSLYGANALGGVVDFTSQTARLQPLGTMRQALELGLASPGLGGSADDRAGATYSAQGRYGPVGIRLGLAGSSGRGFRTNGGSLIRSMSGGLYLFGDERTDLGVSFSLVGRDMGLPGPEPDTSYIPPFGDSTASSRFDHESDRPTSVRMDGRWGHALGDRMALEVSFKPDYTSSLTSFWNLSPYAADSDAVKRDDYSSQAVGGSLLGCLSHSDLGQLVLGYDGRFESGKVKSGINDTNWTGTGLNHALWGEAIVRLLRAATLSTSLRLDLNRDFGQALSPSVGMAWMALSFLKLRAGWGNAFRAPTLSDRYWPGSGVKNIRPEYGSTLQGGFDISAPGCTLSATGFDRVTRDLIEWVPDSSGIWRPANVDRAECAGAELGLRLLPTDGIRVFLSATYLHGIQTRRELSYYDYITGETRSEERTRPAAFVPDLALGGDVMWTPAEGTALTLRSRFRGERVNYYPEYESDFSVMTRTKRLAPFTVIGVDLSQDLFGRFHLAARVDNILNAQYAEQFGNSLSDRDYPMPGRSLGFSLRCSLP